MDKVTHFDSWKGNKNKKQLSMYYDERLDKEGEKSYPVKFITTTSEICATAETFYRCLRLAKDKNFQEVIAKRTSSLELPKHN